MGLAKEHFHPLLVHFPIALLVLGSLFYLLSFSRLFKWLQRPAVIMGVIGTLTGWLAAKTGEVAADVVSGSLCNLELLYQHDHQTETALIFFSVVWGLAALAELARGRIFSKHESPLWWNLLLTVGFVMGSAYLTLGAHKGFRLVYEEGAGIHNVTKKCVPPPRAPLPR